MATTRLRALRLQYGISVAELARRASMSHQQLSRLELGERTVYPHHEKQVGDALEGLVMDRKAALADLELECILYRGEMFQLVEAPKDGA